MNHSLLLGKSSLKLLRCKKTNNIASQYKLTRYLRCVSRLLAFAKVLQLRNGKFLKEEVF